MCPVARISGVEEGVVRDTCGANSRVYSRHAALLGKMKSVICCERCGLSRSPSLGSSPGSKWGITPVSDVFSELSAPRMWDSVRAYEGPAVTVLIVIW